MTENTHYYYMVKEGGALEIIKEYVDGVHKFNDHLTALCNKYGAKGWMLWGPHLGGLQFETDPGFPWKHLPKNIRHYRKDVYVPDSRRKEGKALWVEIKQVIHPEFHMDGQGDSWVIREHHLYRPTFERIGDTYILLIPIHENAEKQFIPVGEVEQLKMSEYWKIKEDNPTEAAA